MRPVTWRLCKSLLLIFTVLFSLYSSASIKAEVVDPSPWLDTAEPSLDKLSTLTPGEVETMAKSVNSDCTPRDITIRPKRAIPIYPYIQSEQSIAGCVTDTAYGALSNNQYLQRQGSTVYGRVLTNNGSTAIVIPIPYSSTGLVMSGGTYNGSYLWFIKNLDITLSSTADYTGQVTHKLPSPYTSSLRDVSGNLLAAQADTIAFSANGSWMVVDLPGIGTARVNTETFEVLPFGDMLNYNVGLGVGMRTAISPDGRFATVASKNFEIFKIYDLSTCGAVPNQITGKVNCKSRNLLPFIKSKVPGFSSIFRMRFRGDYMLEMFINSSINNVTTTSGYALLAPGQNATNFDYLALGDSFASGEGAYQYKSITDTSENKCHLSQRSYPYLISRLLNYGQSESIACSGAKIEDIVTQENDYEGQVKDGLTRKDRNISSILSSQIPGYLGQVEFSDHFRPNIITLSTAGNDIGFSDKIKRCLSSDTCYSTHEDRLEIVNEINSQFYRLTDMYNQVKAGTDPRVKLYVIGYPQIAQPNGNCALNVHLNNDEIIFSQHLISYLNSVVKTAAANVGAFYVDVEDAFAGNKLCETDSWNVAVNGLTAGNDIVDLPLVDGPIGNESFHPNALGHDLLKTSILNRTNNLTAPMPTPNPSAVIKEAPATLALLQAPKSNRPTKITKNVDGTNSGSIQIGTPWTQSYNRLAPTIKGGSNVHAWLNSQPVDLGVFTTDLSGNLTIQVNLPASVPNGFHTLHLYGKNTSDEDTDMYQTVYVTTSGALNQCGGITLSGIDSDKDTIDDACDGFIDQPPIVILPPHPVTPPIDPTTPEEPPSDPSIVEPPATPLPDNTSSQSPEPTDNITPPQSFTMPPAAILATIKPPTPTTSNTNVLAYTNDTQPSTPTAIATATQPPTTPTTPALTNSNKPPSNPQTQFNPWLLLPLITLATIALTLVLHLAKTHPTKRHP